MLAPLLRMERSPAVNTAYNWTKFYEAAVLETDSDALPNSILAAQNAIGQRVLQANVDHTERKAIVRALNALTVLRRERCPAAKSAHS